ncbi:hypothetical protein SSIG_06067 [Streptomyces filamentosus NRRL 11379]|nr:hypothetical protein SSIG_06067 [Streptomyces filamentosus NRRL 11379]
MCTSTGEAAFSVRKRVQEAGASACRQARRDHGPGGWHRQRARAADRGGPGGPLGGPRSQPGQDGPGGGGPAVLSQGHLVLSTSW